MKRKKLLALIVTMVMMVSFAGSTTIKADTSTFTAHQGRTMYDSSVGFECALLFEPTFQVTDSAVTPVSTSYQRLYLKYGCTINVTVNTSSGTNTGSVVYHVAYKKTGDTTYTSTFHTVVVGYRDGTSSMVIVK